MLVHGAAVGRKYHEYVEGQFIPIGSMKNNIVQKSHDNKPNRSIIYISFMDPPTEKSSPLWVGHDKRPISWDQLLAAEAIVLSFLKQYCCNRGFVLKICVRSPLQDGDEYHHFEQLLGVGNWEFIPRSHMLSSYELIDQAFANVVIWSTLGYESIGRGNRTVFFPIIGHTINNSSSNFGWPADLPDNGPFWTNNNDEREFERVMDYITTVSDEEWEETRQRYVSELIEYDPGNTRFIKLMRELGVPLNPEY